MIWPATRITLRLRLRGAVSTAVGLVAVMAAVGALFPSVGHRIRKLHPLPASVANLWEVQITERSPVGFAANGSSMFYGPLVIGALAITAAVAPSPTARRKTGSSRFVLRPPDPTFPLGVGQSGSGHPSSCLCVALGVWVGLIVGVAAARRRHQHIAHITASSSCSSLSSGSPPEPSRSHGCRHRPPLALATGVAAAACRDPRLADQQLRTTRQRRAIAWLKYLTLFYYYAGHDPLTHGVDITGILVLGLVTLLLVAVAIIGFERRDLRA